MNRREATAIRIGENATGVILPVDWVRGNGVKAGDKLVVEYADAVVVRPLKRPGGEP